MEILTTVLQLFILATLWVAGLFLKDVPSLFRALKLEKHEEILKKIFKESLFLDK